MEKMTNLKAIEFVLANCEIADASVAEKLVAMKEALIKRASSHAENRKPTAKQNANEGLKQSILVCMEIDRAYTIGEMIAEIPSLATYSNQKVSALVRQLKEDNLIVRTTEKGKAYFTLAK